MNTTLRNKIFFVVGLTALSLCILAPTFIRQGLPAWWPTKRIKLGLDLRGGSYLVLGVVTDEAVKSRLTSIGNALRADLKKERVGIIRTRPKDERSLEVTMLLPAGDIGEKNINKLDAYMAEKYPMMVKGETQKTGGRGVLTYTMTPSRAEEIKSLAVTQAIETIRNRVDAYGVAEPTIQKTGTEHVMVQLPEITNLDTVKKTIGSVAKLDFRLVADPSKSPDETIELKNRGGGRVRLDNEVLMTGDAIETANVDISPSTNEIEVNLKLNEEGREIFDRITADNVGKQLAIVLDEVVQSSPVIRDRISGGSAQITGGFTQEEAHRLAVVLRSGALPAPLTFEEERTVGASLGADSIRRGLNAALLGSGLVAIFMVLYYRKSGLLSIGCMALSMLFLLSLLALFGATLTLPGIGGLALSGIGMGVDANIIIFERIREELRSGTGIRASIDAGYHKAYWAIMDSNLTTLISGIVLYTWGTGPIKGFAITLCIGVLTTMFAALYISHLGFQVLGMKNSAGKLSI